MAAIGGAAAAAVAGTWFVVWFCGDLPLWSFLAFFALPFDGVFIAEPFCDDLGFAEEDDADDVLFV